jgi:hypothetical protein
MDLPSLHQSFEGWAMIFTILVILFSNTHDFNSRMIEEVSYSRLKFVCHSLLIDEDGVFTWLRQKICLIL